MPEPIEAPAAPAAAPAATSPAAPPAAPAPDATPAAPPAAFEWGDYRTKYAKGDDKLAQRLGRYSSLDSAMDALINAQNTISSKGLKEPFDPKGTPEQQAAWRQANNIPESAEGYEPGLTDEQVKNLSDFEKNAIADYLESAHANNLTQDQVKNGVKAMLDRERALEAAQEKQDEQDLANFESTMQVEWGRDYNANLNTIENFLNTAPPGVREMLHDARAADGTALMSSPDFMRWIADTALTINPVATLTNGSPMTDVSLESEMTRLQGLMADGNSEYWKGPNAAKNQANYMKYTEEMLRRKSAKR